MIIAADAVRMLVATKPVDVHKGMEALAALAPEAMGSDPFCAASMCSGPSGPTGGS